MLYPTPFRRYWHPSIARTYPGLLPEAMDGLTHHEIGLLLEDIKALAG